MSNAIRLPSIAFIVARTYPDKIIGCENKVPWRVRTDMRRFRKITSNHVIIMGRKTFDSIGRPLPDRLNIVLSQRDGNDSDQVLWVKNLESSLFFADHFSIRSGRNQFFVIGGQEIYKVFSDMELFNKIYLTEIFAKDMAGDAYFLEEFDHRKWKTLEELDVPASDDDEYPSRFSVLERKIKTVRQVDLSRFLTEDKQLNEFLNSESTLRQIANQEKHLKETKPLIGNDKQLFAKVG